MTEKLKKDLTKLRFLDKNGETFPEWEEKKLGEVSIINPPSEIPDSFEYIDLESVKKGQILETSAFQKDKSPSRAKRLVKEGDILYSTVRPYQMNNAFVQQEHHNKVASTGFALIRTDKNFPMYLYSVINSLGFYKEVEPLCTGGTYPAVNSNLLKGVSFPIPSLPEQTKIANLLSKMDEKIEQQNKLVEFLKKQKQGYSQKLFNGSLRFKKDDGTDYDDWEEKKLGDFLKIPTDKPANNVDYDKLITVGWWGKGLSVSNKGGSFENGATNFYERREGQFMYGKQAVFNGALGVVPKELSGYFSSKDNPALDFYSNAANETYILNFMLRPFYYRNFEKLASGTGSKRVSEKTLLNLSINLPSLPEQEKIALFLSSLDKRIDEESNKLEQLKLDKNGYMQRVLG